MRAGGELRALAGVFLKLGFVAFGGPAAHIAMLEEEVVARRGWVSRAHFLDLVGATNLIPGPNSTEMALHVGYERAGWRGLLVAGACFILPAVTLTTALAAAYVRWGTVPEAGPFLLGIQAAVIAVIAGALWRLGRTAILDFHLALVAAGVCAAFLLGVGPLWALLGGAALGSAWLWWERHGSEGAAALLAWLPTLSVAQVGATTGGPDGPSLWKLGVFFLKVGAVLYGSGYVLVAFLEGDLVRGYGWLERQELLDAIAIGQFTPGPVLSTAAFIGYLLARWPGAAVAAVAIFLPSFLFVLLLNPVIPRLRDFRPTAVFLDAVNASAVGLMGAVTVGLAADTYRSGAAVAIGLLSAVLILRWRVAAPWIVAGGAVAGWALFGAWGL